MRKQRGLGRWLLGLLCLPLGVVASDIAPDHRVVYKGVDGVTLKLHVFEPAGLQPTDQRAAVVFFFGGGWTSGSP